MVSTFSVLKLGFVLAPGHSEETLECSMLRLHDPVRSRSRLHLFLGLEEGKFGLLAADYAACAAG
jgi:hypothetical protein